MNTPRIVLCVDDDPDACDVLCRALRREDVVAIGAATAEAALAVASGRDVDLLVTDLNLPSRSGVELLAALHARGQRPAALVVSGDSADHTALVESLGGTYLQKPVDVVSLRAIAGALLGGT